MLMKKFLVLIGIITVSVASAQERSAGELKELLYQLRTSKQDTARVNTLLALAEHYIYKPREEKKDLDSAIMLAQQAKTLSEKLSFNKGICYVSFLSASAYHEKGDTEKGKELTSTAIELCKKYGEHLLLGRSYMEMAQYYSPWDSAGYVQNKKMYEQALAAFQLGGHKEEEAYCLKYLGDLESNVSEDPTEAMSLLNRALNIYKSIGYKKMHGIYDLLGYVHANNSDYVSAIRYGLMAVETAEATGDSSIQLSTICNRLGRAYYLLKDYHAAKANFLKAWNRADHLRNSEYVHNITANVVNAYMKLDELDSALLFLGNVTTKYPLTPSHEMYATINSLYVILYTRKKDYPHAKLYCDRIISRSEPKFRAISNYYDLNRLVPYYLDTKQYGMAEECLVEYNKRALAYGSPSDIGHNYMLWFRLDSTKGNFLSAISYLKKYKEHEDSILNTDKSKLMAITRVEYETSRKDQEIKHKSEFINLLTQTNELQKNKIAQSNLVQKMIMIGAVLLLIVFGLLYNQYRIKQKNNRKISSRNEALQRLVNEKELLLQEVHHRVKNNLHTIMSLLESQSAYLEKDALQAIQKSQNRVYAMSLIHQKLYQEDQLTKIEMSDYVPELILHLRDSFETSQHIRFHTDVDEMQLDITQAIPLGLVINEAITNAIKYAFPGNRPGTIVTKMKKSGDRRITLSIKDDGVGLPAGLDYMHAGTLGMKLMKGLSEDIHASFSVETNGGTHIMLSFEEGYLLSTQETMPVVN